MSIKVLIAHAKGEDSEAKKLVEPLEQAGFDTWYQEMVLVGDSVVEETSKALDACNVVVFCGTVKALGTKLARRIFYAANSREKKTFVIQMEEDADVDSIAFDKKISQYWSDPGKATNDLVLAIKVAFPGSDLDIDINVNPSLENKYKNTALNSYDIIDLSNLPENDKNIATKKIELRQLYVPIRLKVEIDPNKEIYDSKIEELETGSIGSIAPDNNSTIIKQKELVNFNRVHLGERLQNSKHFVILGDQGSGKTTLIRWVATAYLLKSSKNVEALSFPDIEALPDTTWLPIIIRCRTFNEIPNIPSHEEIFRLTLERSSIPSAEISKLIEIFQEKLQDGKMLLLIDGLDEITDLSKRAALCEKLETFKTIYPLTPIIVTSRITGYREVGQHLRDFEHLSVADLSKKDKDNFAYRWCNLTEVPERREEATKELIQDIHSSRRIEQLTGNPMLLTTLALVKRKVGRLPSRRVDLYGDALAVLLNWKRSVHNPIEWQEAVPQLSCIAYEMCKLGVLRLRRDEIITILNNVREEYPNLYSVIKRTSEEFFDALEKRAGILIQIDTERYLGVDQPVYEFRHLTFQEYLAARALIDGNYLDRDRKLSLSQQISPLAGYVKNVLTDAELREESVGENWREALRLCVLACRNDDVDDVLLSILKPNEQEDVITRRPRANLAALCLIDEPNASATIADNIICCLVKEIRPDNPKDSLNKEIQKTVKNLVKTRWVESLKSNLYFELESRKSTDIWEVATLFADVVANDVPKPTYQSIEWLKEKVQFLCSEDERSCVESLLSIWSLAKKNNAELVPNLINGLIDLLKVSNLPAQIAAATLNSLNDEKPTDNAWHPNSEELDALWKCVLSETYDPDSISNLVYILGREKHSKVIGQLTSLLNKKIKKLEIACLVALGQIGDESSLADINKYLNNEDFQIREAAVSSIGLIRKHSSISDLVKRINDENTSVCKAAFDSLKKIGGDYVDKIFEECLDDERAFIRALAIFNSKVEQKHYPKIINLLNDVDGEVRSNAVMRLIRLYNEENKKHIEELILEKSKDKDPKVRRNVAIASMVSGDPQLESVIFDVLQNDEDPLVQAFCFIQPTQISKKTFQLAYDKLFTEDIVIQTFVAKTVNTYLKENQTELESKLPSLLDKVSNENKDNLALFIDTLSGIDNPQILEKLLQVINHPNTTVRISVIESLGALANYNFKDYFLDKLDDLDSKVRVVAIDALSKCAENECKDVIVTRCIKDESATVRLKALRTLKELSNTDINTYADIAFILDDIHPSVRKVGVTTLGKSENPAILGKLLDKLNYETLSIKIAILELLKDIKSIDSESVLLPFLNSDIKEIREKTARTLSSFGYQQFKLGNIEQSLILFENCASAIKDYDYNNNAAFCALLLLQPERAFKNLSQIDFAESENNYALYKNNQGLADFLLGRREVAISRLKEGISWIETQDNYNPRNIDAILVLNNSIPVASTILPVDAAILINLFRIDGLSRDEMINNFIQKYPLDWGTWVNKYNL